MSRRERREATMASARETLVAATREAVDALASCAVDDAEEAMRRAARAVDHLAAAQRALAIVLHEEGNAWQDAADAKNFGRLLQDALGRIPGTTEVLAWSGRGGVDVKLADGSEWLVGLKLEVPPKPPEVVEEP